MKILDHDATGAILRLDQRELLMVMALVQEGRDSFDCQGETGEALDRLFCDANVLVERARRQELAKNLVQQKITTVVPPDSDEPARKDGSLG